MKPKVAIIIPVYNVEQYLKQCLDSIINQTLKEIQILCINDGSTDGSLNILKEYANKDKRIQIFNKENGGQGSARNLGIKFINAECVYFVDSDDWLEIDALEKFYNLLQKTNADIVLSGATIYYHDLERQDLKFLATCYDKQDGEICDFTAIKSQVFTRIAPFFKFYRFSFLQTLLENEKLYPEDIFFEDVLPHIKSLLLAKKITFLNHNKYFYRVRQNSTTTGQYSHNEGIFDSLIAIKQVQEFLLTHNFLRELKNEFPLFVCEHIQYHFKRCSKALKPSFAKRAKEYLATLDNSYFINENTLKFREKTLKILDSYHKPKGAIERVKNHLAYKLGKAIINAKSPLKILKLPFTLIKIIQTHKFESKVLKTLYKTHPQLKLPALENYADYEEALKVKEHLSYRLGEAMLKNPLTFPFKVVSIYGDYKRGRE
ncbi:glycosyltransferase family 2 protein [Helicobacter mesocricetorum]|uniref:glycosyltransferase family 2 protein n=1 Tax=Helicobacter mesocricetorum TaxID=87012 RepID=UPI000CF1A14D|nr:glycosyltransferase family 2 protein [Helicobacter mesocricetorum]